MFDFFKKKQIAAPALSEVPFLVLHLSDVHFHESLYGCSRSRASSRLIKAARSHLRAWRKLHRDQRSYSAVLVSGDVAYQSKYDGDRWAMSFLRELLDAAEAPGKRLYIVPGEHDVYLKYEEVTRDKIEFDEPGQWNDLLRLERQGKSRVIEGRFAGYHSFLHEIGLNLGTRIPSASSDLYYADIVGHGGIKVAVLGLNSAWACSCRLDQDRGELCLGSYQVEDAYRIARRVNGGTDPDLVLTLIHHPLEWIDEHDRPALERLVEVSDVIFRGHLHSGAGAMAIENKSVPVLSSSSLCGDPSSPGFLVAAIEPLGGRVHVWPYLWDREKEDFLAPKAPAPPLTAGKYCSLDLG